MPQIFHDRRPRDKFCPYAGHEEATGSRHKSFTIRQGRIQLD
jgi:hypothetical protein